MTGHIFGNNLFQLPYANITGAQVNTHLLTGYFELSAGGVQNLPRSYWQVTENSWHNREALGTPQSPQQAPNCISLVRNLFPAFRAASTLTIQQTQPAPATQHSAQDDAIGLIPGVSVPSTEMGVPALWIETCDGALTLEMKRRNPKTAAMSTPRVAGGRTKWIVIAAIVIGGMWGLMTAPSPARPTAEQAAIRAHNAAILAHNCDLAAAQAKRDSETKAYERRKAREETATPAYKTPGTLWYSLDQGGMQLREDVVELNRALDKLLH